MLSTVLAAHPWLAPAMLAAALAVGPLLGWWLVARPNVARVLAGVALVVVLGATLAPSAREVEAGCVLDWDVRLLAPEPLANVVLLVPVALLVGVATRRPLLGALAGVALSAAVEFAQALVPAIGRSCAAADLAANAVGAGLGALLAAAALLAARRRARAAVGSSA